MNRKIKEYSLSDNELIAGILADSRLTLNHLYQSFFPMVLQLILSNNGSEEDAKDIFQESIIVLYDKVKAGNFELSSKLKTFIYSVCKRLWLKRLNHKGRNALNISDLDDFIALEEDLDQHEIKDKLFWQMEQSLSQLGQPCRAIIEDYYIQNKSMQDISDRFGYTNADNAKTQKYKCMQRLKKIFFSCYSSISND
ncbi:MAG: sigma-70 family RNA polymerase sigma factor [Sphingobacteriaceae bacterium]|nr:MAG: sigma-70 family RNA polymerase sigma factor [Pedobacter sp.]